MPNQTNTSHRRGPVVSLVALTLLLTVNSDLHAQNAAQGAPQRAQPTQLTLGGAARLAATQSATTAAAKARSSQADARVSQRRAELLPSLSTTAQFGTRSFNTALLGIDMPTSPGGPGIDPDGEVRGPVRSLDMRAQVTQRLIDVPALYRWRASATDADAAHFSAVAAAENAAERGAIAYIQVLRAEARMVARAADSALAAELLDIARQQVAAGVGISLDVTRAEAQLADARARLIATRGERDRSMLQLRRELALPADAPLHVVDSLQLPAAADDPIDDDALIRRALEERAEFRAAMANSEGARGYTRAALAERLPTISLYADHGSNGKNTDRLLGTYSYGVQVSLPIFDGMRLESRASEQRARQREAEAQAQDARRQVETEVRSAIVDVTSAREQVAAARARLVLAEQEVNQARERFRNGVSGNADVINASIALNGARDLMIDAVASYQLAKVELAKAQGSATSLR